MSDEQTPTPNPPAADSISLDGMNPASVAAITGTPTTTAAPAPVDDGVPVLDAPDVAPVEPVATAEVPDVPTTPVVAPNAIQDFDLNMPTQAEGTEVLQLPSNLDSVVSEALNKTVNVKMVSSEADRRWAQIISEGLNYNTMREVFVSSLKNQDAEFRQQNKHNNIPLVAASPRFRESDNATVTGERALIQLVTHLGHGTVFQVPLWHTGIWVTFKPPTEAELVELNRRIMTDKIAFGRQSYGLMFSSMTTYSTDNLVNFALEHVYDLTTKPDEINVGNLRQHIASQDIPSLLWGFICTMYPRGFQYERACSTDPDKCKHVVKDTINVSKLQWTDMNSLTDWQKTHMSSRQAKIKTVAEIKRYKEELKKSQPSRFTVNEGQPGEISFVLRSPNIEEYILAGQEWISGIVGNIDRVISVDASPQERDRNITLQGQATAMRQYSHWIESIEYGGKLMEDRDTINDALNVITADDYISNKFIEEVVNYINSSTMSTIGIPVFDCPACGTAQKSEHALPHHVNIIPLDVIQVFFGLITQRLEKIAAR